jgi:hypothetical protein
MIRPTCLATKWYHPRIPHPGCPHFGHQVCDQIDSGLDSGQLTQITIIAYNLDKFMAASLVAGAIVRQDAVEEQVTLLRQDRLSKRPQPPSRDPRGVL